MSSSFSIGCQSTFLAGYEYEFVDESRLLEDYKCLICKTVAKNPKQVNCCGKRVCTGCLEGWIQTHQSQSSTVCPHCKQKLQYFDDTNCHQKIISLRIRCTYYNNGCQWIGELKTFEDKHHHSCTYQVAPCVHCSENIPKINMKRHVMNECKKRTVNCPYCQCKDTYEFVYGEHSMSCRYWLVDCPSGCDRKMTRSEIEKHRETCLLQIVPCCYYDNGCQIMVKRADLKNHEEECPMKVTSRTPLTRGQLQIRERNEQALIAPIMLRFGEFQKFRNTKEMWRSQPFYCYEEGYRVCLVVYPDGCGPSSFGTHMSCFINLHSGHFDDQRQWPFRGVVTVSLRNQTEDCSHYEKQFKFLTCESSWCNGKPDKDTANKFGIGEPLFIRQDHLEKNDIQYLKDDELVFHIRYDTLLKQQPYNCRVVSNRF